MTTDCLRGPRECWRALAHDSEGAKDYISDTVWEIPYMAKALYMESVVGLTDYLRHPINPLEQMKRRCKEERHLLAPIATFIAEPLIVVAASALFGEETRDQIRRFYNDNIIDIRQMQIGYYMLYKWWVD